MTQVSARRVAIWTATVVLVLLGFEFLWIIKDVLFLIFLSILLATGIEPVVRWLRRGPFNRGTGILVVYLVILGVLGLVIFLIVPPISEEGQNVVQTFTNSAQTQKDINSISNDFLKNLANTAYTSANSFFQNFKPSSDALNVGLSFVSAVFSFVTVFVIAFYWLNERTTLKRFVFSFVAEDKRPRSRLIWDSVEEKLGAWMRGQIVLMLFIGVLAGVGYSIIGVKYALALGAFAALAELIPLVGPYIGGAPAVLIALTQNVTLAIIVIVYIVIIQLIEGNVLVPRIMERAVGVSPLTVIVGILIGSTLMGIGGALLAVPVTAAIQVTFNHILSFGSEATTTNEALDGSVDSSQALNNAATARNRERSIASRFRRKRDDERGDKPTDGAMPSV